MVLSCGEFWFIPLSGNCASISRMDRNRIIPLFRGLGTFLATLTMLVFLAAVLLFLKRLTQHGNKAAIACYLGVQFSFHLANEIIPDRPAYTFFSVF